MGLGVSVAEGDSEDGLLPESLDEQADWSDTAKKNEHRSDENPVDARLTDQQEHRSKHQEEEDPDEGFLD